MDHPQISFIVPVYNVASFLPQCIDSLLSQTLQDFEILLIDDGSTDGSAALCDACAARDSRVRALHQKNSGVSAARNAGLIAACGQWICFVDGDDWLAPSFADELFAQADPAYDLLCCGYFRASEKGDQAVVAPRSAILDGEALCNWMQGMLNPDCAAEWDFHLVSPSSCCARLYRRRFLLAHGLLFPLNIPIGEDMLFNLAVFHTARQGFYLAAPLYYYRQRGGSATRTFRTSAPQDLSAMCRTLDAFVLQAASDGSLADRVLQRHLIALGYIITLCLCHPDNPASYRLRRQSFLQLADDPLFAPALCTVSLKPFPFAKRVLFTLMKNRRFFLLDLATRLYVHRRG